MPRIALLANPDSGSGDAERVEGLLSEHGAQVTSFPVSERDRALELAPDRLVVAGGDGSIACVAAEAGRAGVPLAVVPTGTANDFARAMGLPAEVGAACALAATSTRRRSMELGRANGRPFVNLASVGLSPAAAEHAHGLKGRLGALAYPLGAIRAGATATPVRCRVECDGEARFAGEAWQVSFACTGSFGGGASLETDAGDGRLDVVVIKAGGRIRLVKHAWGMRGGRLEQQREVRDRRCDRAELRLDGDEILNVDGELVDSGELSRNQVIDFSAEAGAFELVVG